MSGTARKLRSIGSLTAIIAGVAALALPMVGCKKAPNGRNGKRTVKAAIADFDPNGDIELDLEKYGSGRVDEWEVQKAFNRSFAGLDKCVVAAKKKAGLKAESQLEGDVAFAVRLNPEAVKPFAVHVTVAQKWSGNGALTDCLRDAVADVGFPTYDGPPQVAEFDTQLDPGSEVEAEDDW